MMYLFLFLSFREWNGLEVEFFFDVYLYSSHLQFVNKGSLNSSYCLVVTLILIRNL